MFRRVNQKMAAVKSGGESVLLDASEKPGIQLPATLLRTIVGLPRWVWVVIIALVVGTILPHDAFFTFPERFKLGTSFSKAVDSGVDWMVVNWDFIFRNINVTLLQKVLLPLENWLLGLPWWLVIGLVVFISIRVVGKGFGFVAALLMVLLVAFGLFELAMTTLAIVTVSAALSMLIGVPTGVAMAKNNNLESIIRPILDLMQTMPSFVYLIPVLMLFGLGKVPAVIAVVIYAMPPVIRLTNLGIRQVDPSVVEAALAFGTTAFQLLVKVQLPLAMPTIMAGLNQTIMMALGMVVVASMIGAKGLGIEVLNGIARLEIGRGLLGGVGIVIMAVILDRITQGFMKPRRPGYSAHQ